MHTHEKQSNMLAAAKGLLLFSERDGWYFLSIYAGKEAAKKVVILVQVCEPPVSMAASPEGQG